jgi:radical SAM protein with 4Fe4S-binding SPASM domain
MAIKKFKPMGLLGQIDKHLTNNPANKLASRAKHFYPTSASCLTKSGKVQGTCLRQVVFGYWGVPKTNFPKAEMYYTWGVGKHIEMMWMEWLKEMGLYVASNVKFYIQDFNVSGEIDAIVRETPGSDVLIGAEMKTSYAGKSGFFTRKVITGTKDCPPKPKIENLLQVCLYLDTFKELPYWVLIYAARDNWDRTEYTIRLVDVDGDRCPEIMNSWGHSYIDYDVSMARIYNRYIDAKNYIRKGFLPPCDFKPLMTRDEILESIDNGDAYKSSLKNFDEGLSLTSDFHCNYCDYRDICRGIGCEAKENFKQRFENKEFETYKYGVKK